MKFFNKLTPLLLSILVFVFPTPIHATVDVPPYANAFYYVMANYHEHEPSRVQNVTVDNAILTGSSSYDIYRSQNDVPGWSVSNSFVGPGFGYSSFFRVRAEANVTYALYYTVRYGTDSSSDLEARLNQKIFARPGTNVTGFSDFVDFKWVGSTTVMFKYEFTTNNLGYVSLNLQPHTYNDPPPNGELRFGSYVIYPDYYGRKDSIPDSVKIAYDMPVDNALNEGLPTIISELEDQTNLLKDVSKGVNDLNDTINDSDTSSVTSDLGDFFEGFQSNSHGLSSIITAPLSAIGSIVSQQCSPVGLPLPSFLGNGSVQLPCMYSYYVNNFGQVFNIYQIVINGVTSYWVVVNFLRAVKEFQNPENDSIEVVDL